MNEALLLPISLMGCTESVPDSDSEDEDERPERQSVAKGKGSAGKPTPGAAPAAADDRAAAASSEDLLAETKAKMKKLQWDLPDGADEDGLETLDLDGPNPAGGGKLSRQATIAQAAALADEAADHVKNIEALGARVQTCTQGLRVL